MIVERVIRKTLDHVDQPPHGAGWSPPSWAMEGAGGGPAAPSWASLKALRWGPGASEAPGPGIDATGERPSLETLRAILEGPDW